MRNIVSYSIVSEVGSCWCVLQQALHLSGQCVVIDSLCTFSLIPTNGFHKPMESQWATSVTWPIFLSSIFDTIAVIESQPHQVMYELYMFSSSSSVYLTAVGKLKYVHYRHLLNVLRFRI